MSLNREYVPDWTAGTMSAADGQLYLQYMQRKARAGSLNYRVVAYTHGATCNTNAYSGSVLNADASRIYMVPTGQANATVWHYIDVASGVVVAYTHGVICVSGAYVGGVLAPNGRIYLVPSNQCTATVWHYIDTDGTVVGYTHGVTGLVVASYAAAVLHEPTGRIYLVPRSQAAEPVWHYIDTNGAVVGYTHGFTVTGTYYTGVLSADGRIFFTPYTNYTASTWHYIDVNGLVVEYTHSGTITSIPYNASLGRDGNIYFGGTPHYLDTNTLTINNLTGTSGGFGIMGIDKMFYAIDSNTGKYLNLDTKTIVSYTHGLTFSGQYRGTCMTPNGRIYMIPYTAAYSSSVWHYIETYPTETISATVSTSPYFNKY